MKLNVYFIHPAGLKDREQTIMNFQKQVQKYQFKAVKKVQVKVITEFDPNAIPGDFIQRAVNYSPIKEQDDLKVETPTQSPTFYNQFIKNMHLFQLSSALKHYKALEYIANSEPDTLSIVLEDDVVYEEKLCLMLDKLFNNLPSSYDMIFLGLPGSTEIKDRNSIQYQGTNEVFRVLPYNDSYMITPKAAKTLYDAFLPIKFVMNIHLSYLLETLGLKTVIALPALFIEGSKLGMFISTLNPNNHLVFNQDFMRIKGVVERDTPITPEEEKQTDELISKSAVQNHPDFQYIVCRYYVKQKKFKAAEELYEKALQVYLANNCIVNHESQFLKDYCRLYKNLQVVK
jgi:GR25 family glycosyltransferase involved in LPS biosynthesis